MPDAENEVFNVSQEGDVLVVEAYGVRQEFDIYDENEDQQIFLIYADAGTGDDKIILDASVNLPAHLFGRDGNDLLQGGSAGDIIDGGEHNDELYGGSGDDTIDTGNGVNFAYGEAGVDTIDGGDEEDNLDGGADGDTINGNGGNDTIFGGSGRR